MPTRGRGRERREKGEKRKEGPNLRCRQEGGVGRDEKKERKERKVFPATTHASKPGTHQRRKGEILSITFRKTPESKERKGGGQGEKGAKFSTGSNEP